MKVYCGSTRRSPVPWFAIDHVDQEDARELRQLYRELRRAGLRPSFARLYLCGAYNIGARARIRQESRS